MLLLLQVVGQPGASGVLPVPVRARSSLVRCSSWSLVTRKHYLRTEYLRPRGALYC
jgi:hypothetical protein